MLHAPKCSGCHMVPEHPVPRVPAAGIPLIPSMPPHRGPEQRETVVRASMTMGLACKGYSFSHGPPWRVAQAELGVTSHGHEDIATTQVPNEFIPLSTVGGCSEQGIACDSALGHVHLSQHFRKAPSLDIMTLSMAIAFVLF